MATASSGLNFFHRIQDRRDNETADEQGTGSVRYPYRSGCRGQALAHEGIDHVGVYQLGAGHCHTEGNDDHPQILALIHSAGPLPAFCTGGISIL